MDELKRILAQAIENDACVSLLNPLKRFIEQGDKLQAWQTVLGNCGWLYENEIEFPDNLEELAEYQAKAWYKSGALLLCRFYKKDKVHGDYKIWDENGELFYHGLWKDDLQIKRLL